MNKPELLEKVAARSGVTVKQAEEVLEAFEQIVYDTLKGDGDVTLTGFGTFSAKYRSARKGVNPQNPTERIDIPAVTVPKFKAGKTFKDTLKGKVGGSSSTEQHAHPHTEEEKPAPVPEQSSEESSGQSEAPSEESQN